MYKTFYNIIVVGFFLTAALTFAPQRGIAGGCATNCTGVPGSGMNCAVTATLTCPPGFPSPVGMNTMVAVSSYGANCILGAADDLMVVATHMAGAGTNSGTYASCVFSFFQACQNLAATGFGFDNVICTVNAAGDGLPVELLEFSVDIADP